MSALSGRYVRVYRTWGGTWDGEVVEHNCAGIMITAPTRRGGALFIPWDKVQWLDVDLPRETAA